MQTVDVVVIGAGPAGTVAASYLKKQGYNVTILEKENFRGFRLGKVCFLAACMHLEESGLLEAVESKKLPEKDGAQLSCGAKKDANFSFRNNLQKAGHGPGRLNAPILTDPR
jgi:2-polyprenyl-6-methoxyphenol hydroxylase-like FAD-dependent oxidoreductase